MIIIHFIKYRNIYLNPFLLHLLRVIVLFYLSSESHYCDDNYSSYNTYNNTQQTINGYQTQYSDGTPIYQPYYENKDTSNWNSHQVNDQNGRPVYQAYNSNLQPTSRGYRYEMSADTPSIINNHSLQHAPIGYRYEDTIAHSRFIPDPTVTQENFRLELDGNVVYAKYYGTDINGINAYTYSNDGSTMLGIIEPTRSEIINNGYYTGPGLWKIVDTSSTKLSRRFYNKIKIGIKNHIAKSNPEAIRQHNLSTEKYMNDIRRSQMMSRERATKRYIDRVSSTPLKVRRFD